MIREREYAALPGLPVALGLLTLIPLAALVIVTGARTQSPLTRRRRRRRGCALHHRDERPRRGQSERSQGAAVLRPLRRHDQARRACAGRTRSRPRSSISQRVRNFESAHLKVNDNEGNPIEIAAVVVWRVVDTAEAVFEVDDYDNYVKVQTEAALRNLATSYTYDTHDDAQMSLRGHTWRSPSTSRPEIQERLTTRRRRSDGGADQPSRLRAGDRPGDAAAAAGRRHHRRAQRIVEGAVGMVEMALEMLSKRDIVSLDNERKAAMVSNLLVVLCGDRSTQPVINAGTIYQ